MADQETSTLSIRDRINAFNIAGQSTHLTRAPITANKNSSHDQPPAPQRPSLEHRSQSGSHAPTTTAQPSPKIGNEPNIVRKKGVLPPPSNIIRSGQQQPATPPPVAGPKLPPRKAPPPAVPQRQSLDVENHGARPFRTQPTKTVLPDRNRAVKAPAFDPASLPPLPKRSEQTNGKVNGGADRRKSSSSSTILINEVADHKAHRGPSPQPAMPERERRTSHEQQSAQAPRRLPPPADQAPPKPSRPSHEPVPTAHPPVSEKTSPPPAQTNITPPPIPLSSRPDLSQINTNKPPPVVSQPSCLVCRDFSSVDAHAARFPRQNVPDFSRLAHQLTSPFPSLTDRARAIFTWLHHNIEYDVRSFFAGTIQPSTPASTLQSGLAVCEGYAALFSALAAKAGLECVVIGGHGKGFGFAQLAPGAPLPPESPGGHAWNAVRIDNGEWKLVDACWGAGNISGPGQPYNKQFSPRMFTMSNAEFGLRHYPANRRQFYLDTNPPTWAEYLLGPLPAGQEALRVYSGVAESEGISETSFQPPQLHVPALTSAQVPSHMRFQFSRACEHWDPMRNGHGKDFVFILAVHGVDGRQDDFVPFETNGMHWWCDVETRKLGTPGQTISAFTVDTVNGQPGRGMTVQDFRAAKGRKAMGFAGLAAWELV